jgi:hypothetical protein
MDIIIRHHLNQLKVPFIGKEDIKPIDKKAS